jgi:hypothetical protein
MPVVNAAKQSFLVGLAPLSATDTSAADLTGNLCPGGYCHLGGSPISDNDAYGNGLVYIKPFSLTTILNTE